MDLVEGQRLEVHWDPANPHDANACAVRADSGLIGHLPAQVAAGLVAGSPGPWLAKVTEVLRGQTWGVRAHVTQLLSDPVPAGDESTAPEPSENLSDDGYLAAMANQVMPDDDQLPYEDADSHQTADQFTSDRPGEGDAPDVENQSGLVYARSGRCLGRLIRTDGAKVVVRTATGGQVSYPCSVIKMGVTG